MSKKIRFITESWGANKGLGEAPKSYTRKEHESATNSIAKRGQGAIAPCRVKGQRPLWGLGQRPNCSASDQSQGSHQQRCRQRSVPAPNFARPQTRPQAALPPRFRDEPKTQTAKRRVPLPARRFAACANYFCLSPDLSFCSAASAAACSACFFVRPVPWASSTPKRLTAASNVRLCGGPSCAIIS